MSYTDEDRKGILKGQCLNIAFQGFNRGKFEPHNPEDERVTREIRLRVETAHDIFNRLMKEKFLIW